MVSHRISSTCMCGQFHLSFSPYRFRLNTVQNRRRHNSFAISFACTQCKRRYANSVRVFFLLFRTCFVSAAGRCFLFFFNAQTDIFRHNCFDVSVYTTLTQLDSTRQSTRSRSLSLFLSVRSTRQHTQLAAAAAALCSRCVRLCSIM